MKKAIIYYFALQNFEPVTGYKHNQEIPYESIFRVAEWISNTGLNIMIINTTTDNGQTPMRILYVDDKNFKQR